MTLKGYLVQVRIGEVSGADNQIKTLVQLSQPLTVDSVIRADYSAKAIMQGMSIHALEVASEKVRGVVDIVPEPSQSHAAIADSLFQLASLIRDEKFSEVRMIDVRTDSHGKLEIYMKGKQ